MDLERTPGLRIIYDFGKLRKKMRSKLWQNWTKINRTFSIRKLSFFENPHIRRDYNTMAALKGYTLKLTFRKGYKVFISEFSFFAINFAKGCKLFT